MSRTSASAGGLKREGDRHGLVLPILAGDKPDRAKQRSSLWSPSSALLSQWEPLAEGAERHKKTGATGAGFMMEDPGGYTTP